MLPPRREGVMVFQGLFCLCIIIFINICEPLRHSIWSDRGHVHIPKELPGVDPCNLPDTSPCSCLYSEEEGMTMWCSDLKDEDELRSIMNKPFITTTFDSLYIQSSRNLKKLREGDLGILTFRSIFIGYSGLTEIEDKALNHSRDSLTLLDLSQNEMSSVPDISSLARLDKIYLDGNSIRELPEIKSRTLTILQLASNSISEIPVNATVGLPALKKLFLSSNAVKHILPETFTRNANLESILLPSNSLTAVPNDAITLHGKNATLGLSSNQIANLTYESVSSVRNELQLVNNRITELPEKVYRPLLEKGVLVYLQGNPLACGCDMAWLVVNQTLMDRLPYSISWDFIPTCANGTWLENLDPGYYKAMCNITMKF